MSSLPPAATQSGGKGGSSGAGTVLHDTVRSLLLAQVQHEFAASQLYLSASFYFEDNNFSGIAKYLRAESESERTHGLGISDYLLKRGVKPQLSPLDAPRSQWEGYVAVFECLLEAEKQNTQRINTLAEACLQAKNHLTYSFLKTYLDEQVNSEDEMVRVLTKVKAYSKFPGLLYHLDAELG